MRALAICWIGQERYIGVARNLYKGEAGPRVNGDVLVTCVLYCVFVFDDTRCCLLLALAKREQGNSHSALADSGQTAVKMLGSARHFGLRGNALSWAVGMLAGCDFL